MYKSVRLFQVYEGELFFLLKSADSIINETNEDLFVSQDISWRYKKRHGYIYNLFTQACHFPILINEILSVADHFI